MTHEPTVPFYESWFYRHLAPALADALEADGLHDIAEYVRTTVFVGPTVRIVIRDPAQYKLFQYHKERVNKRNQVG